MADEKRGVPEDDREVRLSQVPFSPRNYSDATIAVDDTGWMAKSSRNGARVISQTGVAQGQTTAPTHFRVVKSEQDPTEYCLVPTNQESDDFIKLTWYKQGRAVRFHAGKLLALKGIDIPAGTRMVAKLFHAQDSKYGHVVGIHLNKVEYVPKESKTALAQQPPASA
jgi:hypothetical protein